MRLGEHLPVYSLKRGKKTGKKVKPESFAQCHDKIKHKASGSRSLEEATTKQPESNQLTIAHYTEAIVLASSQLASLELSIDVAKATAVPPPKYDIPCLGSHLTHKYASGAEPMQIHLL